MAKRSIRGIAGLALNFLAIVSIVQAQQTQLDQMGAPDPAVHTSGGLCAHRLIPRQLRVWRSIEEVALAVDRQGQPLHQRLHSLWRWAQTSQYPICIELWDRKRPATYQAGTLDLEKSAPDGQGQTAVIRLYLWVIDNASVQSEAQQADGFIPFKGLRKNERYAQVLGHELAHAALMLEDPGYARLCRKLDKEKADFLQSRGQRPHGAGYNETARQHLARLQTLTDEIEAPAHATEVEIWRELLEGQRARK